MKLYDYWAPWCAPCKMMDPILQEIDDAYPTLEIIKINVDEEPEAAAGITSVPTYIIEDNDGNRKTIIGAMPKYKFLQELGL